MSDNKEVKICASCKATKPLDEFHRQRTGPSGRHSYCKICYGDRYKGRRKRVDPAARREANLKLRYGISSLEASAILASQGGVCAICREIPARAVLDHSHSNGALRGVLCHGCNIKLPAVEDAAFLESALAYLARFRG